MTTTARNATIRTSEHPPYYCADCERAHDGSEHDVATILGRRGVTRSGVAYAYCDRERLYHWSPNGATVPIPRKHRWNLHDWPTYNSVRLDVRDLDTGRRLRGAIAGPLRTFTIATYTGANDRVAALRNADA